jgi:uncharacterized protein YndB with AHSA1/START domain
VTAPAAEIAAAVDLPPLVLTRTYPAPRDLVFRVWTEPQHMAAWWGPHGFTAPRVEADPRPGGKLIVDMRGPDGFAQTVEGTFREVSPPERLSFSAVVREGDGSVRFEVLTTVTLAESGGGTLLTLTSRVLRMIPSALPDLAGAEEGWSQTLERLGTHLATL